MPPLLLTVVLDWLTLHFSESSVERGLAEQWRVAVQPSWLIGCILFLLHGISTV